VNDQAERLWFLGQLIDALVVHLHPTDAVKIGNEILARLGRGRWVRELPEAVPTAEPADQGGATT
jgi:hypothetical protein